MHHTFPERLNLQWHLTDQCNFRCKHCYQDAYAVQGPNRNQFEFILEQFASFLEHGSMQGEKAMKAHINFTGGEPFLRHDFIDLLELTKKRLPRITFGILSNGTLPPPQHIDRLRNLCPSFVQISLEGSPATNDYIRGEGATDLARKAARVWQKAGIKVLLSFTANRLNYREFPVVCRLARRWKVHKVWSDRYLPTGKDDLNLLLSPTETREFFDIMLRERERFTLRKHTRIGMQRALQFLAGGGQCYRCSAGDTLLTVMPNGDLLPCRRMSAVVGNLYDSSMETLYFSAPMLVLLRDKSLTPKGCEHCFYLTDCHGGLKCLAYTLGMPYPSKDPGCWLTAKHRC